MATKKPSPLEDPPAASSSEEEVSEEEVESDEEEESEEEEAKTEQKQQHPTKKSASTSIPPPTTTTPAVDKKASKKPETQPQSSSDESGSESESDSDHPPPGVADPNVKPISSKPMDDASKLKKPRSKPTASASVVATPTKSAAKRPVENIGGDVKDSKRAKKKGAAEVNGDAVETAEKEKKPLFQRLWSEDDEIVILKGIMDFTSKKGADPIAELDVFHDFIKKSLHIDVTRTQLLEKMRRLRKKYENNAGKGKNGADRTFSKPHEQKAFDLSKKVWGIEANNGVKIDQAAKSNGKAAKKSQKIDKRLTPTEKEELLASLRGPKDDAPPKKDTEEQFQFLNETSWLHQNIAAAGLDASFMMKGLGLINGDKRSELDEKWRELLMAETEIFLRRSELVREQTKLVLDAYKKNQSF